MSVQQKFSCLFLSQAAEILTFFMSIFISYCVHIDICIYIVYMIYVTFNKIRSAGYHFNNFEFGAGFGMYTIHSYQLIIYSICFMTILRLSSMRSLSNMKQVETVDLGNGYQMDLYNTSVRMSTYLLAFIVSEFESYNSQGRCYVTL